MPYLNGKLHKHCRFCGKFKPLDQFGKRTHYNGTKVPRSYCKSCNRARRRQQRLGIDPLQFTKILKKQDGVCAICRTRPGTHADHDHRTGEFRGVLCMKCNTAIGFLDDDPTLIKRAYHYLKSSSVGVQKRHLTGTVGRD